MTAIELEAGPSRAVVSPLGAEMRAWSVDGVPLLWEPDPAIWADVAPVLFPVVGWTRGSRILVDGRSYPLGLHGFARGQNFAVVERSPSHVRFALAPNEETKALYPFDWRLELEYRLEPAALRTELVVGNAGLRAMPYACGLHPGFRWPFAGGTPEDYAISFAEAERDTVPVISPDGLFTRAMRRVPLDGRRIALSPDLMSREALCFLDLRSRAVAFAHEGGATITVELEDFPHLALWSRPGGRYLCIEAWTGHGDYVDANGDLFQKASMRHLAPGESARHAVKFSFVSPQLLFRQAGLAVPGKPDRTPLSSRLPGLPS